MPDQQPLTATEVKERQEEWLREMQAALDKISPTADMVEKVFRRLLQKRSRDHA